MKISKDTAFQPITITLESQGEVDLLLALVARASGGHENSMFYGIFNALGGNERNDEVDMKYSVASGSIRIEEK